MSTPEAKEPIDLYAALMEEIKLRLDVIRPIVTTLGRDAGQPTDFVQAELCILQIRLICELVALAALAAHHSLGLTNDLLKHWNAERIFRDLEKVNEHCFPRSATVQRDGKNVQLVISQKSMPRGYLMKIYSQCGEMLHRGIFKHILSGKERIYDLQTVHQWAQQIGELLSVHVIMMLETEKVFVVSLAGGANGSVEVALAEGGPAVFQPPTL